MTVIILFTVSVCLSNCLPACFPARQCPQGPLPHHLIVSRVTKLQNDSLRQNLKRYELACILFCYYSSLTNDKCSSSKGLHRDREKRTCLSALRLLPQHNHPTFSAISLTFPFLTPNPLPPTLAATPTCCLSRPHPHTEGLFFINLMVINGLSLPPAVTLLSLSCRLPVL